MVSIKLNAVPMRRQVLDGMRRAIIDGELAPGERLREVDLCAASGVSRTVIREALRQLEAEGLIVAAPNKGAIVRALTQKEAQDIYCIRGMLEGLAARFFAKNASLNQIEMLAQELKLVEQAYLTGDVNLILDSKDRFYELLFEGGGSEVLTSMLRMLNARISRWRALGLKHPQRSPNRTSSTIRELKLLIKALRSRNADEAERIAKDHVNKTAVAVMRLLNNISIEQAA